jgi:hypothetical protein
VASHTKHRNSIGFRLPWARNLTAAAYRISSRLPSSTAVVSSFREPRLSSTFSSRSISTQPRYWFRLLGLTSAGLLLPVGRPLTFRHRKLLWWCRVCQNFQVPTAGGWSGLRSLRPAEALGTCQRAVTREGAVPNDYNPFGSWSAHVIDDDRKYKRTVTVSVRFFNSQARIGRGITDTEEGSRSATAEARHPLTA